MNKIPIIVSCMTRRIDYRELHEFSSVPRIGEVVFIDHPDVGRREVGRIVWTPGGTPDVEIDLESDL